MDRTLRSGICVVAAAASVVVGVVVGHPAPTLVAVALLIGAVLVAAPPAATVEVEAARQDGRTSTQAEQGAAERREPRAPRAEGRAERRERRAERRSPQPLDPDKVRRGAPLTAEAFRGAVSMLDDRELRTAWRHSCEVLSYTNLPELRLQLVALRQAYLDEMERRDPERFTAWLAGSSLGDLGRLFTRRHTPRPE